MLVLTRRENERIVFPEVGITVELVSINGSRARIGVDAPAEVRILRHEIAEKEGIEPKPHAKGDGKPGGESGGTTELASSAPALSVPLERKPNLAGLEKPSHRVRNHLNSTNIAAQLLRKQLDAGLHDDAEATVRTLLQELEFLQKEVLQPKPAAPAAEADGASGGATRRRPRALLVEDDQNEQSLLAGFLRMAGFDIITASDGREALDYLVSNERPDVVLLDMLMPHVDGPTAVNEIRQHPALQGLKIFAVSGTSPKKLGVQTGPGGIDRWFHKPIDPEELAREMARDLVS
jgi:carbon storage regulator CsrA